MLHWTFTPGEIDAPTTEKKSTTALSMISRRRCKALLARRLEPMFLFLRVAYHSEYFPVHQIPKTRKKLPGSAWPLKLPMIAPATPREKQSYISGYEKRNMPSAPVHSGIVFWPSFFF